jgi:alkyldihydroxyacetonephosphate synthase
VDPLGSLIARLPEGAVSTHPGELAARSRDHWPLAMLREARGDRLPRPMAVVFARTTEEVAEVLAWAAETGTPVVPRGAGSGVCGGAQAVWRSVVLDLSRMTRVLSVDEESLALEVEAGARGDRVEAELAERGLTLGHYPQSLAISSVGGWIAARAAGQASAGYGSIEDLLLGLTAVLPGGEVATLRPAPRSAAGPDLRRLFCGSEGTLGVVTEVVLSISRAPDSVRWRAFNPASFEDGLTLVRSIVQRGVRPLVARLYDEADAGPTFAGLDPGGPVLILALEGGPELGPWIGAIDEAAGAAGVRPLSDAYGDHWWEHRFDAVDLYQRVMGEERMFGSGVVADTMEVAALWSALPGLYVAVRDALLRHAVAVGCHLSHPYRSGASLYFTFLVRADDDVEAEDRYLACWKDAAAACHGAGATVTHHHGVGLLKAPFMGEELGAGGLELLRRIKAAVDPAGLLNPGKLLPPPDGAP